MNSRAISREWFFLAIYALVALTCLLWLTLPAAPPGIMWDDAWYLWMAEWFSGREPLRDVAYAMNHARQYPPLFPLIVSWLPGSLEDITAAIVMNCLLLTASAVLVIWWLRYDDHGWGAGIFAATLLLLNPVALTYIPFLASEPMYLLFSLAVLYFCSRSTNDPKQWLLIGIFAGLAVITRSVGWALILALLISVVQGRRNHAWKALLPALALPIAVGAAISATLPDAQSYLFRFQENLETISPSNLLMQFGHLWQGWQSLWGSLPGALITAALTLPGLILGIKNARPAAWYIVIYCGMLMLWPFPEHNDRFLWVLMPACVACMARTAQILPRTNRPINALTAVLGVTLLLSIPGGIYLSSSRLIDGPGAALNHLSRSPEWTRFETREQGLVALYRHQQIIEDSRAVAMVTELEPFECIYSEHPALVSLYSRRAVFGAPYDSLDQLEIANYQCAFYYVLPNLIGNPGPEVLAKTGQIHFEIFRSRSPAIPDHVLGIMYRLNRGTDMDAGTDQQGENQ